MCHSRIRDLLFVDGSRPGLPVVENYLIEVWRTSLDLLLLAVFSLLFFIVIGVFIHWMLKFNASHQQQDAYDQRSAWYALFFLGMMIDGSPFQDAPEPEEMFDYQQEEWYDQEPDPDDYD